MYYTSKTVAMWRHASVQFLLAGLIIFVLASGVILCVRYMKKAESMPQCFVNEKDTALEKQIEEMIAKITNTTEVKQELTPDYGAMVFPFLVLILCTLVMLILLHIRLVHSKYFRKFYDMTKGSMSMHSVMQGMQAGIISRDANFG